MKYGIESFIGSACIYKASICSVHTRPHSHQVHISVLIITESVCKWEYRTALNGHHTKIKWCEMYGKCIFDGKNGSIRLKAAATATATATARTMMPTKEEAATVAQMSLFYSQNKCGGRQRTDRWLKDLINNLWKVQVHHRSKTVV